MPTLDPDNNNNNNKVDPIEAAIKNLPLEKQFSLKVRFENADSLSREDAISLLKQCMLQMEQKDLMYLRLMKDTF